VLRPRSWTAIEDIFLSCFDGSCGHGAIGMVTPKRKARTEAAPAANHACALWRFREVYEGSAEGRTGESKARTALVQRTRQCGYIAVLEGTEGWKTRQRSGSIKCSYWIARVTRVRFASVRRAAGWDPAIL